MTDVAATAVLASLLVGLAIATWNAVRLRAPLILNAAHGLLGEIIGGLAAGMLMVVYLFFAIEDWRHHPVEIPIYIAGISGGATGTLCGLYLSERRSARAPLIAWVGALGAYGAPVLAAWAIWLL